MLQRASPSSSLLASLKTGSNATSRFRSALCRHSAARKVSTRGCKVGDMITPSIEEYTRLKPQQLLSHFAGQGSVHGGLTAGREREGGPGGLFQEQYREKQRRE